MVNHIPDSVIEPHVYLIGAASLRYRIAGAVEKRPVLIPNFCFVFMRYMRGISHKVTTDLGTCTDRTFIFWSPKNCHGLASNERRQSFNPREASQSIVTAEHNVSGRERRPRLPHVDGEGRKIVDIGYSPHAAVSFQRFPFSEPRRVDGYEMFPITLCIIKIFLR